MKTKDYAGTPEMKVLDKDGRALNHDYLKVEKTQDWRVHHAVFNSQDRTEATLVPGCWDGTTGELWWDDAALEESAFSNPDGVREWLKAAAPHEGVEAVMYTTWQNNYRDMEAFFKMAREASGPIR